MCPDATIPQLIGRDIPWEKIERRLCKVVEFLPVAKIESGNIIEVLKFSPYALVTVEITSSKPETVIIPVLHKLDFQNLWKLFREMEITEHKELEVELEYIPVKAKPLNIVSQGFPSLVLRVLSVGSIRRRCDWAAGRIKIHHSDFPRPIVELDARPKELR